MNASPKRQSSSDSGSCSIVLASLPSLVRLRVSGITHYAETDEYGRAVAGATGSVPR
ncbi:MAG: hypothetical protein KIT69_00805 [Propionibacteriaceae bacterium]|nr:hypothetical protein [Propionibacteriaceae bacterium]